MMDYYVHPTTLLNITPFKSLAAVATVCAPSYFPSSFEAEVTDISQVYGSICQPSFLSMILFDAFSYLALVFSSQLHRSKERGDLLFLGHHLRLTKPGCRGLDILFSFLER